MKFKLLNKPWFYLAVVPLAVLGVHVFELGVFVYEIPTRSTGNRSAIRSRKRGLSMRRATGCIMVTRIRSGVGRATAFLPIIRSVFETP